MKALSSIRVLGLSLALLLGGRTTGFAQPSDGGVTIGVVRDGQSWFFDDMFTGVSNELATVVGDQFRVRFKETDEFNAGWDHGKVKRALNAALNDPEVDIVLALGLLSINAAGRESQLLTKPVACALHQDVRLVEVELDARRRPQKENLSLVVTTNSVGNDVRVFQQLAGFDQKLHLVIAQHYLQSLGRVREIVAETERELGITISAIPMDSSADAVAAALPADVEAIYIGPPVRMSVPERNRLVQLINARKIPTFAYFGVPAVENGVLAGLLPDIRQQLARRVAINLHQIMRGVPTSELDTILDPGQQLTINVRTMQEIGLSPPFDILSVANLIQADEVERGESLNLRQAVEKAVAHNFELLSQQERTESSRQSKRLASSPLLPQASATYQALRNKEVTGFASMFNPRSRQSGSVAVRQLLFDDATITRYRVAHQQYLSAKDREDTVWLDVTGNTAVAYVQYLAARKLLQIARDNLRVTRKNIELAQLRVNAKIAGVQEIYRFKSQEQGDQREVASADASLEQARVSLNQLMGVELKARWIPEDLTLEKSDPYFGYTGGDVTTMIANQSLLDSFRDYSVELALKAAPELRAVDRALAAQRLTVRQKKRRYFVPSISSQFEYARTLERSPANTDPRDSWTAGLVATLPLFEGGGRRHDIRKNEADLRALEFDRENTRRMLDERTRQVFYQIESSYPTIEYSAKASELADKNLEVVTLQYRQGETAVIDLLDAQNSAFVQRQNAALAVYQTLIDLVRYQRSIAWFEFMRSDAEKQEWVTLLRKQLGLAEK